MTSSPEIKLISPPSRIAEDIMGEFMKVVYESRDIQFLEITNIASLILSLAASHFTRYHGISSHHHPPSKQFND
jgi:hypothetical protein